MPAIHIVGFDTVDVVGAADQLTVAQWSVECERCPRVYPHVRAESLASSFLDVRLDRHSLRSLFDNFDSIDPLAFDPMGDNYDNSVGVDVTENPRRPVRR